MTPSVPCCPRELGQVGPVAAGDPAFGVHDAAIGQHDLQSDHHVLDLPYGSNLPGPPHASQPPTVERSIDWGQWPRVSRRRLLSAASNPDRNVPARTSAVIDTYRRGPGR